MAKKFGDIKDEETRKILEEMEEEGEDLPELAGKKPVVNAAEEDQDDDDDASTSDDEDSDEEDNADSDETDEESQDDEDEEDSEDVESDDETSKSDRSKQPSWKWKKNEEERKQLKEENKKLLDRLEAIENKDLSDEDRTKQVNDKVEAYAKKHKLDPEEVKEMFGIVLETTKLPKEVQEIVKQNRENRFWEKQDDKFEDDFDNNVVPVMTAMNPKLSQDDILNVKNEIYELAFDPKYVKKSLVSLYLGKFKGKERRVTGEDSKGSNFPASRTKDKDLENMSEEDIDEMDDEEFDKFSEKLGKKSKSRIVRH